MTASIPSPRAAKSGCAASRRGQALSEPRDALAHFTWHVDNVRTRHFAKYSSRNINLEVDKKIDYVIVRM